MHWFVVDKCTPFGASISCANFQALSEALRHITEVLMGIPHSVTNYLDDFLFYSLTRGGANYMVRTFLTICKNIGFPVSLEKMEWGTFTITFLGIILNGKKYCLAIPEEKVVTALSMVSKMMDSKKTTVKQIQRLVGTLNFLKKVIQPGRPFMRRMYAKYARIVNRDSKLSKLKHYHHVTVDREFKNDCQVWRLFLLHQSAFALPMTDFDLNTVHTTDVGFYTDASRAIAKGVGCVFGTQFTWGIWEAGYIDRCQPSIAYLELYALCVGIFTWQEELKNIKMIAYCDNIAVRDIVNQLSGKDMNSMYLIRLLTLNNLIHNRMLKVIYLNMKKNNLANALSRREIDRFFSLARPKMSRRLSQLPKEIWPPSKIWQQ